MIYLKDSCVINLFVAHLRKNGHPNLQVNGLPPGVDKIWYADTADVRDIPFEKRDITFEDFTSDLLVRSCICRYREER